MGIDLVTFDLDDTVIAANGSLAPGIDTLLRTLTDRGIRHAIVSNRPRAEGKAKLRKVALQDSPFYGKEDFPAKKGSPLFISKPCDSLGIALDRTIYVGHSELDMRTAANAQTLFFNASWAGAETSYGVPVAQPMEVWEFIKRHLSREHLWFSTLNAVDKAGRSVHLRTLIDGNGGGDAEVKRKIIRMFKSHAVIDGGQFNEFVANQLLGSLYLSGLHRQIDYWAIYPGHNVGNSNPALEAFLRLHARHFREKLLESLILRHTAALKSAFQRTSGAQPTIANQTKTVMLDPQYRDRIRGKSLLVVDDFVTEGNSLECARNLLVNAGAKQVIGVAIGKYGIRYDVHTLKDGVRWNSFSKSEIGDQDFFVVRHQCTIDPEALAQFVVQAHL